MLLEELEAVVSLLSNGNHFMQVTEKKVGGGFGADTYFSVKHHVLVHD